MIKSGCYGNANCCSQPALLTTCITVLLWPPSLLPVWSPSQLPYLLRVSPSAPMLLLVAMLLCMRSMPTACALSCSPLFRDQSTGIYRPYTSTTVDEGYIFIGVASFPFGMRPPELIPDPDIVFTEIEYASIGLGRNQGQNLPYGPLDWVRVPQTPSNPISRAL